MIIIEENLILIITEEKEINDSIKKYRNIDVLSIKNNVKSMKEINMEAKEKYSYIFFTNECNLGNELVNFLPVFSIDNCCNKLFMNELLVNPIIIDNIEKIIESNDIIALATMLKHILKRNIKKEDFVFDKEIRYIKELYNCTDYDMNRFKNKIYNDIEKHYSQDSITRKIKYRMNKDKIVKIALYKLIDVINSNLKNTNELVFKKFISVII